MKRAIVRAGVLLVFASTLQACIWGDDDSSPKISVDTTHVAIAAEPGDAAPTATVTLTVSNLPKHGVYVAADNTNSGIETLGVQSESGAQFKFDISFRVPALLADDTYDDTIDIRVCKDAACDKPIRGSPVTVHTTYAVSGGIVGTIAHDSIELATQTLNDHSKVRLVRLTYDKAPASTFFYFEEYSSNALLFVSVFPVTPEAADLAIEFRAGSTLPTGKYNDTVTLKVCYELSCLRQVGGSPFAVTTRQTVNAAVEPGYDPLQVSSRLALGHDVIDAEFSKSLNAIVMVGRYPSNALYVYDVASGSETQQSLVTTPTSVSLAADGMTAAVGHDALISLVDLTQVGQAGAPEPALLNVSTNVFDLVLDGNRKVYALPRYDQWVPIHTVDIATNTETLSIEDSLYAGSFARLNPSGDYLYAAESVLQKWGIATGTAEWLYNSPYLQGRTICANLWFNESGDRIYTACGNTFHASTDVALDMTFAGALELPTGDLFGRRIRSLSQSETNKEIALVEGDHYTCDQIPQYKVCFTHVLLYESDSLNRLATFLIPPVTIDDVDYSQLGLFIFHDAAGRKLLVSQLENVPAAETAFYLSVID